LRASLVAAGNDRCHSLWPQSPGSRLKPLDFDPRGGSSQVRRQPDTDVLVVTCLDIFQRGTARSVQANDSANYGFNAQSANYEDLVDAGVIDPAKVTRSALQNAASIAVCSPRKRWCARSPRRRQLRRVVPAATVRTWTTKKQPDTVAVKSPLSLTRGRRAFGFVEAEERFRSTLCMRVRRPSGLRRAPDPSLGRLRFEKEQSILGPRQLSNTDRVAS
jgi:hypothetical protein